MRVARRTDSRSNSSGVLEITVQPGVRAAPLITGVRVAVAMTTTSVPSTASSLDSQVAVPGPPRAHPLAQRRVDEAHPMLGRRCPLADHAVDLLEGWHDVLHPQVHLDRVVIRQIAKPVHLFTSRQVLQGGRSILQ